MILSTHNAPILPENRLSVVSAHSPVLIQLKDTSSLYLTRLGSRSLLEVTTQQQFCLA
jgi:hypothetical protein